MCFPGSNKSKKRLWIQDTLTTSFLTGKGKQKKKWAKNLKIYAVFDNKHFSHFIENNELRGPGEYYYTRYMCYR